MTDTTRKLATIVALDVAGYSARTEADEARTVAQVAALRHVIEGIARAHGGRIFNTAGDGFMLEFSSSFNAVEAALELADECRPRVRVGVHIGEVSVQANGDLLGHGVNVAARLMAKAEPGSAIISADVCRLIRGPMAERFVSRGPVQLDKMQETIEIFAPASAANAPATAKAPATPVARALPWKSPSPRLAAMIGVPLLLLIVAAVIWTGSGSASKPATDAQSASIAVLPFENLSTDKDNAFFAVGIQDEILTRLSKIGSLKVISRTSTAHLASRPENVAEIASQLGVTNILEGSVQRAGDMVRVNVQLIRADTDAHLWAEVYDRKLDNIFNVQTEIATAVANALNAKVTGGEQQAMAQRPTSNVAAYDAYLRGLVLTQQSDRRSKEQAIPYLEEAVRLDPDFAQAWAILAGVHEDLYFDMGDATPARRAAAREALDNAVRLAPDLPDVQLAQGQYDYYIERDYKAARETFERLYVHWPNNPAIVQSLGLIQRRFGVWDEAKKHLSQSVVLDPRSPEKRFNLARTHTMTHDYASARQVIDEALNIWPDNARLQADRIQWYLRLGKLDEADAAIRTLNRNPPDISAVGVLSLRARMRRQYADGATDLAELLQAGGDALSGSDMLALKGAMADLRQRAGEDAAARALWLEVRDGLLELQKQQPYDTWRIDAPMSAVLFGLGDTKGALAAADRAVQMMPTSKDAATGPSLEVRRVSLWAQMGDRARAIPELARLTRVPGTLLTPAVLRLDPVFDKLRGDPNFDALTTGEPVPLK